MSDDKDANQALSDFKRFPRWMWRNKETLGFVEWLREHNEKIGGADDGCQAKKAGFYGEYSMLTWCASSMLHTNKHLLSVSMQDVTLLLSACSQCAQWQPAEKLCLRTAVMPIAWATHV